MLYTFLLVFSVFVGLLAAALLWYYSTVLPKRVIVKSTGKPLVSAPVFPFTGLALHTHGPLDIIGRFNEYIQTYGTVFQYCLVDRVSLLIADAEVLKDVTSNKNFLMRMYPPIFDFVLKQKGVLFTNDMHHWKLYREAIMQGMMNNRHLKKVTEWAVDVAEQMKEKWMQEMGSSQVDPIEVDVDKDMSLVALDIIGAAAFGIQCGAVKERDSTRKETDEMTVSDHVKFMMESGAKYNLYPVSWTKYFLPPGLQSVVDSVTYVRKLCLDILRQRHGPSAGESTHDLLDILMKHEHGEEKLKDEDISYACWDLFIAGHETTAHALAWTLMELAKNPSVQEKLFEEVERVLPSGTRPTYDLINTMPYLNWVVKESLRLHPVVPIFTKISEQTEEVAGLILQPKTAVIIYSYAIHRDPKFWPEPERFIPERWEDNTNPSQIHAYFPFGFGPRICLGNRFAMLEARVVLASILQDIEVLPTDSIDKVKVETNITMKPIGLNLKFRRRDAKAH